MRRFLLKTVALGAIATIALGMALTASARQDNLATVRAVTARFNSLEQAKKAGYVRFYVCTEQPGVGTMGQHYVNFKLVGDPAIDPLHPEALVYEPRPDGTYKLVALEWVRVGTVTNPGPSVPAVIRPPLLLGRTLSIDWLAELLEDFPLVVGVLFGGLPCLVGARRLVF